MKFGIILEGKPVNECVQMAKAAERYGFDHVWVPDESPSPPYRDVFVTLTAIALGTKTIKVGTCICPVYTTHPARLAVAVLSLDEVSNGRAIVGIGPGGSLSLAPLGIKMWEKPITAMKETTEVLQRLFKGETLHFNGKTVKVCGAKLFAEPTRKIPVYFAARSPKLLSLVGEVADGGLVPPALGYFDYVMERIRKGAEKANKNMSEIDIAVNPAFYVFESDEEARKKMRPQCTYRIAQFPTKGLETIGITKIQQEAVKEALRLGDSVQEGIQKATELVTDKMVDALFNAGTPEKCIRGCLKLAKAGATQLICSVKDIKMIKIIGEEIIPEIRSQLITK